MRTLIPGILAVLFYGTLFVAAAVFIAQHWSQLFGG